MNHSFRFIVIPILLTGLTLYLTSCKPEPTLAVVTTANVTGTTQTTAISGGNVTSDGNAEVTARGVCWGTSQNPTTSSGKTSDGTGTGTFISSITGLTPGTNYYVRAYATNSAGTSYGNQQSFSTAAGIGAIIFNPDLTYGTVSDIDGNSYKTIQIGTQTWMAENLKTTKYKDGSAIPDVTDNTAWGSLTTPGYCWYNNDAALYQNVYGALYNWYAVSTGKLCPAGWHVPYDPEWTTLTTFLGGGSVAGGKLKETGITHWATSAATNESGFTALPGSYRDFSGQFNYIGSYGYYWSSTENPPDYAWGRLLFHNNTIITRGDAREKLGMAVRCLKD